MPRSSEDTTAFYRRWIIVNFPNIFEGEKNDKFILDKITTPDELSGMLNFALEGLARLLERGDFTASETTEQIRHVYLMSSDSILVFVEKHVYSDGSAHVPKEQLYTAYCSFCKQNGLTVESYITFCKRIPGICGSARDFNPSGNGGQIPSWRGVRLKTVSEMPDEKM